MFFLLNYIFIENGVKEKKIIMNKILTIVIPAYNVENYLDEILPTFLDNELLNDIEIIIVNDGSKDNTAIIASEYEKKYPQTVVLIDKENGGHGSTINSGIKHANGKYLRVIAETIG